MTKGIDTCNRTACQTLLTNGAIYYNHATRANYCPHCAFLINKHNPDLCKLIPLPEETLDMDAIREEIISLKSKLLDMYPEDGKLSSPRDIKLAKEINRFASYIHEIEGTYNLNN